MTDRDGRGDDGREKQGDDGREQQQGGGGQQNQQQGGGGQQNQQQDGGGRQGDQQQGGQQQGGQQQGGQQQGGQQQGGQQQGGQGGQQQGDQQQGGQQQDSGNQKPSTAEKVLTGISVVVTLTLFGYVAWHAVQAPSGTQPRAEVVGVEELASGQVLVEVRFTNDGDQGLISATAEVSCGGSSPGVTFSNVPAGGVQQATVVCPSGTENPEADVSSWIPT